jgi:hypothetical protein
VTVNPEVIAVFVNWLRYFPFCHHQLATNLGSEAQRPHWSVQARYFALLVSGWADADAGAEVPSHNFN